MHFPRCPLPAPDGPCMLTRPLGEDGINNNNKKINKTPLVDVDFLSGALGPRGRA